MTTSLRVLHTTREMWAKALSDETIEHHPLLKLLQEKGRIRYGGAGTKMKWTVKFKKLDLTPYGDMDTLTFARNTTTKTVELDWRGYKLTDAISELEEMENSGSDEQILSLIEGKLDQMKDDASDQLGVEFYRDGNLAGNENRLHGIESMMKLSGASTDSEILADTLADTYAGLSTTPGTYGGTSAAQREYDFWSPVIVNSAYSTETWATAAVAQMRRAILYTNRGVGRDQSLDLFLMPRSQYEILLTLLDAKQRQIVPSNGLAAFGFPNMVAVDGVEATFDPDMPATDVDSDVVNAYGFNTAQMEFQLLGKKKMLWNASGDSFREENMAKRFWCGLYGNLKFKSPRYFAKIAATS